MPQITFLGASDGTRLSKTFRKVQNTIEKEPYPNVLLFNSATENYEDCKQLQQLFKRYGGRGWSTLGGNVHRALNGERRAGATDRNAPTRLLCLDADGIDGIDTVAQLIDRLPACFHGVDYVVQHSASAGFDPGLRAHIFMLLAAPTPPMLLKQYLRLLNFEVGVIERSIRLTRTGMALSYPLDPTVAQNDKLVYIAPPTFDGVDDPLEGPRIRYVRGTHRAVELTAELGQANPTQLESRQHAKINALRVAAGLERIRRKSGQKYKGTHTLVYNGPDAATVTGVKVNGEFTYLNLNGGDSWGYYHLTAKPELLYNFKDEPVYKLEQIAPDYYGQARERAAEAAVAQMVKPDGSGRTHLAFTDPTQDCYFYGWVNVAEGTSELHPSRNKAMSDNHMKVHRKPIPDPYPQMRLVFDPANDRGIDLDAGIINSWMPSPYLRKANRETNAVPAPIERIIWSAVGSDRPAYDTFLNWLAFIVQQRRCTNTAWLLHGTQGTGKGALFSLILRPLFGGEKRVPKITLDNLEEPYNDWAQEALIVQVDEIEVETSRQRRKVEARLKTLIADTTIPLRVMHRGPRTVPNFLNFILASNVVNAIDIPPNDRRFHVAPGQHQKLGRISRKEEKQILERDLYDFAGYLMNVEVDTEKVHVPLDNEARQIVIDQSKTGISAVTDALRDGDLGFFIEQLPSYTTCGALDHRSNAHHKGFEALLKRAVSHAQAGSDMTLPRDDVQTLVSYCAGTEKIPTAAKFTQLLRRHGLFVKSVWIPALKHSARGLQVRWRADEEVLRTWEQSQNDDDEPEPNA